MNFKLSRTINFFTGRGFRYGRSLEIIQDQEYLRDIEFDEIRRYDILEKIGEFDRNVNIPKNRQPFNKKRKNRVDTVIIKLVMMTIFR